jgi:hypothetical protein
MIAAGELSCTAGHRDSVLTPTFTNASYVVGRRELTDWQERMAAGTVEPIHVRGLRDSVLLLVEAGQVDPVDKGFELAKGAVLTLLPGHTAGQMGAQAGIAKASPRGTRHV